MCLALTKSPVTDFPVEYGSCVPKRRHRLIEPAERRQREAALISSVVASA